MVQTIQLSIKSKRPLDADKLLRLTVSANGFIFDPTTGQSFTANESGLKTLDLLRAGVSLEQCACLLAEIYNISEQLAAVSIEAFIQQVGRYL